METHREFEALARDYLQRNPGIGHEWRRVDDSLYGGRTDLIVALDSEAEVFATLRDDAIAIGDKDGHVDFEDFGRGLTRQKLATMALAELIKLLARKGHVSGTGT